MLAKAHLHTAAYDDLDIHAILSHEDGEREPDERREGPPERTPAREDGARDLADGCDARTHAAESLHLYGYWACSSAERPVR